LFCWRSFFFPVKHRIQNAFNANANDRKGVTATCHKNKQLYLNLLLINFLFLDFSYPRNVVIIQCSATTYFFRIQNHDMLFPVSPKLFVCLRVVESKIIFNVPKDSIIKVSKFFNSSKISWICLLFLTNGRSNLSSHLLGKKMVLNWHFSISLLGPIKAESAKKN